MGKHYSYYLVKNSWKIYQKKSWKSIHIFYLHAEPCSVMLTPAAFKQRLDFRVVDLLGAFLAAERVDEDEQSLGPACA